jgi:uncharacterized protein with ParB-like and HNH nuclease domain/predicted transport protein|tara:strand:+ start:1689 stop:3788 length:2100 start_codon:yes stop_codon:yes gene_type:complete
MQASDDALYQIVDGSKQFLIPIFQRTYRWGESNCEALLNDIMKVANSPDGYNHFMGSVVLISSMTSRAGFSRQVVIDGQQRLTTTMILTSALLKQAEKVGIDELDGEPLESIREQFLVNRHKKGDERYKLLLTKSDKRTLCEVVDGNLPEDKTNRVWLNHEFFCSKLIGEEEILKAVRGLRKLKVVEVTLHQGIDDPQSIFESLNSTGVGLSQADLIRNYVLMRQDYDTQTRLYQGYWYPMEQLFGSEGSYRFDRFMQDFLTLETGSNALLRSQDVYNAFKEWFSDQTEKRDIEQVIKRLLTLARFHAAFMFGTEKDKALREAFKRLRSLAEVASPVVMRLYETYAPDDSSPTLTQVEFLKAINCLESYLLRRQVCGMQTRSLGNIFATLAQQVQFDNPLITLKVSLARFKRNSRFPSDTEFDQALKNHELYGLRILKFLLTNLENRGSKEVIDTSNFSVEHVMPQNQKLRIEWREMLGDDWKDVQEKWLHRLGNLTLTGYNSEYSDSSFSDKQTIKNGFKDSPLRLNRYIAEQDIWTENQIEERGQKLAIKALKIWKPLDVEDKLVAEYELKDRQARSRQHDPESVLGKRNMPLYEALKDIVMTLGDDITPIVSKKNVTFYTLSGFLQIVPRSGYLGLIMAVEQEELDPELAQEVDSTHEWSYIRHGSLSGVYSWVAKNEHIKQVLPVIQQAYEQALS